MQLVRKLEVKLQKVTIGAGVKKRLERKHKSVLTFLKAQSCRRCFSELKAKLKKAPK